MGKAILNRILNESFFCQNSKNELNLIGYQTPLMPPPLPSIKTSLNAPTQYHHSMPPPSPSLKTSLNATTLTITQNLTLPGSVIGSKMSAELSWSCGNCFPGNSLGPSYHIEAASISGNGLGLRVRPSVITSKMINNTAQRLHRPPIGGKDLYVECRSLEN